MLCRGWSIIHRFCAENHLSQMDFARRTTYHHSILRIDIFSSSHTWILSVSSTKRLIRVRWAGGNGSFDKAYGKNLYLLTSGSVVKALPLSGRFLWISVLPPAQRTRRTPAWKQNWNTSKCYDDGGCLKKMFSWFFKSHRHPAWPSPPNQSNILCPDLSPKVYRQLCTQPLVDEISDIFPVLL